MRNWNDPAWGLFAVDFLDRSNGIAVGDQGKIFRTKDGGESWTREWYDWDTNGDFCGIGKVKMADVNTAFAIAAFGRLLKSSITTDADVFEVNDHSRRFLVGLSGEFHDRGNEVSLRIDEAPKGTVTVEVFDVEGKRIKMISDVNGDGNISLGGYPSGAYFVLVSCGRHMRMRRFLVR